jgi:hypothetical protein
MFVRTVVAVLPKWRIQMRTILFALTIASAIGCGRTGDQRTVPTTSSQEAALDPSMQDPTNRTLPGSSDPGSPNDPSGSNPQPTTDPNDPRNPVPSPNPVPPTVPPPPDPNEPQDPIDPDNNPIPPTGPDVP